MLLHRQVRAVEYRRLSVQASTLAQSSTLENVREKHELAAERWAALAALDEAD
jgi:cell division protein FtsL